MGSATAFTSAILWLIITTPRPRSRTRSMRLSTSAVCATPSAAVGSSRMMIFGSTNRERAMATVWRWPPDSDATGIADARDARRQLAQQLPCARLHLDLVQPGRAQLLTEEQVRDDVEVLAQREVLKHRRDAQAQRGLGSGWTPARPRKRSFPRRPVHAGQDLHERGLAGAVVADDGDDLARGDVKVDVGQRRDGTERLRDASQAQDALTGTGRRCGRGGR